MWVCFTPFKLIINNSMMGLLQGKKTDFILYMLTTIAIPLNHSVECLLFLSLNSIHKVKCQYCLQNERGSFSLVRTSHLITLTFIQCACDFVRREAWASMLCVTVSPCHVLAWLGTGRVSTSKWSSPVYHPDDSMPVLRTASQIRLSFL